MATTADIPRLEMLQVADMVAREKGIDVFVDGAHAFAHFPFTRDEIRSAMRA